MNKLTNLKGKAASESQAEMSEIVHPALANVHGTIFGGQIMEWVDVCGAISAMRHSRHHVVTASMDDLHFLAPVRTGQMVILRAKVNYTHKTSMEVGVKVEAEDPVTGAKTHTADAFITFVAVDQKTGKPTVVPPVIPRTKEEKRLFDEAKIRRKRRLKRAEEARRSMIRERVKR